MALGHVQDEIKSMHSDEPHKNNMDKEKQRKLATGRYDSQRIHTVVPQSKGSVSDWFPDNHNYASVLCVSGVYQHCVYVVYVCKPVCGSVSL